MALQLRSPARSCSGVVLFWRTNEFLSHGTFGGGGRFPSVARSACHLVGACPGGLRLHAGRLRRFASTQGPSTRSRRGAANPRVRSPGIHGSQPQCPRRRGAGGLAAKPPRSRRRYSGPGLPSWRSDNVRRRAERLRHRTGGRDCQRHSARSLRCRRLFGTSTGSWRPGSTGAGWPANTRFAQGWPRSHTRANASARGRANCNTDANNASDSYTHASDSYTDAEPHACARSNSSAHTYTHSHSHARSDPDSGSDAHTDTRGITHARPSSCTNPNSRSNPGS